MGVNSKGKRKIIVDGDTYYWYVTSISMPWLVDAPRNIYVFSADKKFRIEYIVLLPWENVQTHLKIHNQGYGNLSLPKGQHCFLCPTWENEQGGMIPSRVRDMVLWCLSQTEKEPYTPPLKSFGTFPSKKSPY